MIETVNNSAANLPRMSLARSQYSANLLNERSNMCHSVERRMALFGLSSARYVLIVCTAAGPKSAQAIMGWARNKVSGDHSLTPLRCSLMYGLHIWPSFRGEMSVGEDRLFCSRASGRPECCSRAGSGVAQFCSIVMAVNM